MSFSTPRAMPDLAEHFPSSLRRVSQWLKFAGESVPVVVMRPIDPVAASAPALLWFHGRTVSKELDSGRYLRLVRAGVACVAVDLPGHGERLNRTMQEGERTLEIVEQAAAEIDRVLADVAALGGIDMQRIAIGGMSAGGMVAMVRGCSAHPFTAMLLESTTGDWNSQRGRPMFRSELVDRLNPIDHLDGWREIPVLALHSERDEWVPIDGQRRFIDALRARAKDPELIQLHAYPETGAPHEHMGFGRVAADAKDRGTRFLVGEKSPPGKESPPGH